MADAQRDLWPDLAVLEPQSTPLTLLKEQAAALARKTNGLLEGHVHTISPKGDDFLHIFKIVAPTMDNYSYELFRVIHDVLLYPATFLITHGQTFQAPVVKTELEFVAALKRILSSPETMRVISALLAQAKA